MAFLLNAAIQGESHAGNEYTFPVINEQGTPILLSAGSVYQVPVDFVLNSQTPLPTGYAMMAKPNETGTTRLAGIDQVKCLF